MAITSITSQSAAPGALPGQGVRSDPKPPENAATSRIAGLGGDEAAIAAVDKRSVAVNAQKADQKNDLNQEPDAKTVTDAVERVKQFVQTAASDVQFSIDEESGMRVIKVVDKETNEVIRQMPSKEVVELAKALDKLQGLMIKQTA